LTINAAETLESLTVRATASGTSIYGQKTVLIPTVKSVAITSAPAKVARGDTAGNAVAASVTVANNETSLLSTDVTWSVTNSGIKAGTKIENGKLCVDKDETATPLTIKATSSADSGKSATASVTVSSVTAVTVSGATVNRGSNTTLSAEVTGTNSPSQTVTWSITSAYTTGTSIDSGYLTVAPGETNSSLTVKATSAEDNRISGTATVQIPTVTGVTVTPSTADVAKGGNFTFSADVAASGGAGTGVTWSIVTSGVSANTKFPNPTTSGLFQVASDETKTSITIKATSTFDGSKSGTATVAVPQPTVTGVELSPSGAVGVKPGNTQQFSATVSSNGGSVSQNVTWSIVGTHNTGTTISGTGNLTVASNETEEMFTVKAISTADTGKYGETKVYTKSARFVAVALESAKAAYSYDGITWTEAALPVSTTWHNVTYGGGRFVVVGGVCGAAYSADGITWTAAATPPSDDAGWEGGLTYGNGKFVATSMFNTKTAYSTDGNTWTTTTKLPVAVGWYRVVYGNGKFVAISGGGSDTKETAYSTDGINWTQGGNLPSNTWWYGLTYGNNRFVTAAGAGAKRIAYSTDGINWMSATTPPDSNVSWEEVAYGNSKFVALNYGGYKTAFSTDGNTWMEGPDMPSSDYWRMMVYGDGKFVAIPASWSSGSTKVAYLPDGETSWQAATMPSSARWWGLAARTD
jgi:hypothetical protein